MHNFPKLELTPTEYMAYDESIEDEVFDLELDNVRLLIKEAYFADTGISPIINIRKGQLHFLMMDVWAPDNTHKTTLCRIVQRILTSYEHRTKAIVDCLIPKIDLTGTHIPVELAWLAGFMQAASLYAENEEDDMDLQDFLRDLKTEE